MLAKKRIYGNKNAGPGPRPNWVIAIWRGICVVLLALDGDLVWGEAVNSRFL
jgi:hypothetical protein